MIGHYRKRRKTFLWAAGLLVAFAAAIWLAPVAYRADGSVAVANDHGANAQTYSNDCSDAVWPDIPAACLKNESDDVPRRVISIPETGSHG